MPGAAVLAATFFFSGSASLGFEVIWTHEFSTLLGSTSESMTVVFAGFLGLLALGGFVCGRSRRFTADPLKYYAMLECGIGVAGVAAAFVLLRYQFFLIEILPADCSDPAGNRFVVRRCPNYRTGHVPHGRDFAADVRGGEGLGFALASDHGTLWSQHRRGCPGGTDPWVASHPAPRVFGNGPGDNGGQPWGRFSALLLRGRWPGQAGQRAHGSRCRPATNRAARVCDCEFDLRVVGLRVRLQRPAARTVLGATCQVRHRQQNSLRSRFCCSASSSG